MGVVLDFLTQKILRQVNEHGVVVWFDPERAYSTSLDVLREGLAEHDCSFASYKDSFFALRHELEQFLGGDPLPEVPPRLVVYIPLDRTQTHDALSEVEATGVCIGSRQGSAPRNTRLALVARDAFKATGAWTNEDAARVEREIDSGALQTVEEVEKLFARRGEATGVLQLIFGGGSPDELALRFLSSDVLDVELQNRGAVPELSRLFRASWGNEEVTSATPAEFRAALSRYILLSELRSRIEELPPSTGVAVPRKLNSVPVASEEMARQACQRLAREWRLRTDLRESYASEAARIERELGLTAADFSFTAFAAPELRALETLPCLETALLRDVEKAWLDFANDEFQVLGRTCQERQGSFWSERDPGVQAHWALLGAAGTVLAESNRVEAELKASPPDVVVCFSSYTQGEHPWCALDAAHRALERRFHDFDGPQENELFPLSDAANAEHLDRLIVRARQRYTEVGEAVAQRWIEVWSAANFEVPGALRQNEVWKKRVAPSVEVSSGARGKKPKLKVAYVWVDALRFEMARELREALADDGPCQLDAALATAPTVTEVGMAALLPGAETGRVFEVAGKLGLQIGDKRLSDRASRIAFLREHCIAKSVSFAAVELGALLPAPKKKLRDELKAAQLILVTSQEIDGMGESGQVHQARREMDVVLRDLRRAFRVLGNLGVEKIVVAADHGFLFGEEIGDERKLEAPGGEKRVLKRRVWLGCGGASDDATLRVPLAQLQGEPRSHPEPCEAADDDMAKLDLVTPRGFTVFKASGGLVYFHGGVSPQEIIVPVLELSPRAVASQLAGDIEWSLTVNRPRVTTRFFAASIGGRVTSLIEVQPPKVRLELFDPRRDEPVSTPVSASYGFEEASGDLVMSLSSSEEAYTLETNTVTLMLDEVDAPNLILRLLDATTGATLEEVANIEVTLQPF